MKTLTVTQTNKAFIFELGNMRLVLMNTQALAWHLSTYAKLSKTQIASFIHTFDYEDSITIQVAS
jgi:hypothetical protein